MRKYIHLISLITSLTVLAACEYDEPEVGTAPLQYQKFIGGAFIESLTKTLVLADGSVLILASRADGTTSARDYYLVKTDNNGNLLWEQQYGGSFDDRPKDMILLEDGSLMILGYMTAPDGDRDFVLLKTNSMGELTDSLSFGQAGRIEEGNQIIQLQNGQGFVMGGTIKINNQVDDNLFYKINNEGTEIIWSLNYGNLVAPADVIGLQELADEQILWVGNSNAQSVNNGDVLISVINKEGLNQSLNYYGQNNQRSEFANSLIPFGNEYLIAGFVGSSDQAGSRGLLLGLSYNNEIAVSLSLTNETDQKVELNSLATAPDKTLLVAGKIESSPDNYDIYLSKWDLAGNTVWERTYGGAANDEAISISVENGQITLTGSATVATNQSLILLRTDLEGNLTE